MLLFPYDFFRIYTIGAFAETVLKIGGSMLITKPVLNGTPINCWFILTVGTLLVVLTSVVYYLLRKFITQKKFKKQQIEENK